jgi:hypothetical protein
MSEDNNTVLNVLDEEFPRADFDNKELAVISENDENISQFSFFDITGQHPKRTLNVFSGVGAECVEEEMDEESNCINYSVDFLHLESKEMKDLFGRRDVESYQKACGTKFTLPLYPPVLPEGIEFNPDFYHLARVNLAYKIRKVILEDELTSIAPEIKKLTDLVALCDKKKSNAKNKVIELEHECNNLMEADQAFPSDRVNALLSIRPGYGILSLFLSREFKRIHLGQELGMIGEEFDGTLTLETVRKTWKLLQQWQLLKSVEYRCRLGPDRYPGIYIY